MKSEGSLPHSQVPATCLCRGTFTTKFGFDSAVPDDGVRIEVTINGKKWESAPCRLSPACSQLRRIHTYHTVPMPCRSAKGLDCVFPFDLHSAAVFDSHIPCHSPAMPRICRSESDLSRSRHGHGKVTAWYMWISIGEWQGRGRGTAWYMWIIL
jgi:hypothetical protein